MTLIHKGATIFYTDQGEGSPLILLHGFLENHTMWDLFIPALTKRHRVICVDLLGHGQSQCTGYVHTMESMANAVHSVITTLKLDPITIIGHSLGGYVGIAFAKAYPQNLIALCLLNSTPEADNDDRKILRSRANEMAKTQYRQLVRMSFTNLFDPVVKKQHAEPIAEALVQALKTPVQGYIAANSGMQQREDHRKFWNQMGIKKGMILGESDWIINARDHQNNYSSSSSFFSIIKSGHMSHISNFEKTLLEIMRFLSM